MIAKMTRKYQLKYLFLIPLLLTLTACVNQQLASIEPKEILVTLPEPNSWRAFYYHPEEIDVTTTRIKYL